jgi:hypothetical protein
MRQGGARQQIQRPPTPPVDPDNEEFVVFVRAKKLPRWIPFTIVKGGTQANLLVKAMNGNFGKEFYSNTLINNIAQVWIRAASREVLPHPDTNRLFPSAAPNENCIDAVPP